MPIGIYKHHPQQGFQKGHPHFGFKKGEYKHSKETRQKISQSNKGRSVWNKGKKGMQVGWNKGKYPEYMQGSNNSAWKGGKNKTSKGYIRIYQPNHPFANNNYVLEHRLVIEKQIGRYLLPSEDCHHLGTKDDNRTHMLMAFSSTSAHNRFHNNPNNVKPKEIIFDGRAFNVNHFPNSLPNK